MTLSAKLIKLELLRPACAACERCGVRRGAGGAGWACLAYLLIRERPLDVLLVGKHEERRTSKPLRSHTHTHRVSLAWQAGRRGPAHLLLQQCLQLCLAVPQPHAVGRIHHPDEPVSLLEIVAPVGAQ
jgi:hypothetical protein